MIHYYIDNTISAGHLLDCALKRITVSSEGLLPPQHLVIQFTHNQYYLPEQPSLELLALLSVSKNENGLVHIEGCITIYTPERLAQLQHLSAESVDTEDILYRYCRNESLPWLVLSDPWLLSPIHISKPWGQEIWYTGIEARGQAGVVTEAGDLPLPWLLELMTITIGLEQSAPPVLLKVLDPLADEVYGDLYFELHQQKQEVYVVTHIDKRAWPTGVGAIQLGFAAELREQYPNDEVFKQAYLGVVKEYESIRSKIDRQLDEIKRDAGVGINEPVTSTLLTKWINELSQLAENKALFSAEHELRKTMNSFVASHPLVLGDVVAVPKRVPHALQHGVRVVEFQTPVYERKILSFGQKVLTQSHWDTEEALELVNLDFSQLQASELLVDSSVLRIERIVNFNDFEVRRVQFEGGYDFHGDTYFILMVLDGQLILNGSKRALHVHSGVATLIPPSKVGWTVSSSEPCLFLLASPKSSPK